MCITIIIKIIIIKKLLNIDNDHKNDYATLMQLLIRMVIVLVMIILGVLFSQTSCGPASHSALACMLLPTTFLETAVLTSKFIICNNIKMGILTMKLLSIVLLKKICQGTERTQR